MGCCSSTQGIDYDRIYSEIILKTKDKKCKYHGTTQRGRLQKLGKAELILTDHGIYSQVIGTGCLFDRGFLHIPLFAITDIREQDWFNGLYRLDRPHLIITYIVPGRGEYQAGWQMSPSNYRQWRNALQKIIEYKRMLKLGTGLN